MRFIGWTALFAALLAAGAPPRAEAKGRQAKGYGCEKKSNNGADAGGKNLKTRKECKKQGGKWVKIQGSATSSAGELPAASKESSATLPAATTTVTATSTATAP